MDFKDKRIYEKETYWYGFYDGLIVGMVIGFFVVLLAGFL